MSDILVAGGLTGLPLSESKVTNKKFKAEKVQDILSNGAVVNIVSDDDAFRFRCSSQSVDIRGSLSLSSRKDLEDFAKLVSDAWKFHLQMKSSK